MFIYKLSAQDINSLIPSEMEKDFNLVIKSNKDCANNLTAIASRAILETKKSYFKLSTPEFKSWLNGSPIEKDIKFKVFFNNNGVVVSYTNAQINMNKMKTIDIDQWDLINKYNTEIPIGLQHDCVRLEIKAPKKIIEQHYQLSYIANIAVEATRYTVCGGFTKFEELELKANFEALKEDGISFVMYADITGHGKNVAFPECFS
jgi:hypothetical protein